MLLTTPLYALQQNFDLQEKAKEELAQSIALEKQNRVFGDFVMQLRLKADFIDNVPKLRSQTQ